MWSGSNSMCRFARPAMTCSPSVVSPRALQWSGGRRAAVPAGWPRRRARRSRRTARPAARRRSPGAASWFLSCASGFSGSQCRMSQNESVSRKLAALTADTDLTVVPGDAGQRVVELVDQLHLAHPHARAPRRAAVSIDSGSHSGDVATGHRLEGAAERHAGLDAHDHGHLPGVDHPPGLPRAAHDPVEALAGSAPLRVDVVLERVHVLRLQADRVHVVAGVLVACSG